MSQVAEDQKIFLDLPIGGFLRVNDEIAMIGSMQDGNGVGALEYEITGHKNVLAHTASFNDTLPIRWHIYTLENADGAYLLFWVREVTTDEQVIIDKALFYYPYDDDDGMSREDMFEADILWMFDQPTEDPWQFCDLGLNKHPKVPPIGEEGEDIEVKFEMKKSGVMFGMYHSDSLDEDITIMITEYEQGDPTTKNPRMIIIEEDFLSEEGIPYFEGGIVEILLGCSINDGDLEVI